MSSWSGSVTDRLAEYKLAGMDFSSAWDLAMRAHPPRGRDAGLATPRLFDEDGRAPDSVASAFKRYSRFAYEDVVGLPGSGNGPALRHFTPDMIRLLDSSAPAMTVVKARRRVRQGLL